MTKLHQKTQEITDLVLKAQAKAYAETSSEPEPGLTQPIQWPVQCLVGPGLEGAIACESQIGYVNGAKGWLIYRGYDIFELCAYSTYEEVAYLLIHGHIPSKSELNTFKKKLALYRYIPETQETLAQFPIKKMQPMSALSLGTILMGQEFNEIIASASFGKLISSDEDSIPMETKPRGEEHAIYEFKAKKLRRQNITLNVCYHLIAGVATITAAIARLREGKPVVKPDPNLSHAANLIYMMTGKHPSPAEERIMDIALILHADHGMNASTFASMVVASTLSDIYLSIGSGIAALNGPLHGGANEQVLKMLQKIKNPQRVKSWYTHAFERREKITGFGHRVYKAYDPRARVLGPLAEHLAYDDPDTRNLFLIAKNLEAEVIATLGEQKKIFPNVDFYSGLVYRTMKIPSELFTPIFAVSRVAGWTARILEYLKNNRIFRPRAMYTGLFNQKYIPARTRTGTKKNP
ncbi:MAG: citrate/2-methylcitrate synthase [Candidatus Omnitrophica bacterium]|nr:citrate/2-methylcitrate synthase [Candidatus Omnitrophota bacterium]